jgi:hypothetical protein
VAKPNAEKQYRRRLKEQRKAWLLGSHGPASPVRVIFSSRHAGPNPLAREIIDNAFGQRATFHLDPNNPHDQLDGIDLSKPPWTGRSQF